MPHDPRARALIANAAVYAAVIAIMAAVNLWQSPDYLWFLWVAAGWGIGIAAQAVAYVLNRSSQREPMLADPKTRRLAVHAFSYVAVIALLFVVNLLATPHTWWFYWVALGWGAGLAMEAWCAFSGGDEESAERVSPQ